MTDAAQSFLVEVALFAEPEAMRAWLARAEAGAVFVYATAPVLPRENAAAALARRWAEAGLVVLLQERSTARRHCFDYVARRSGQQSCRSNATLLETTRPAPATEMPGEMKRVLAEVERLARAGAPFPGYGTLATLARLRRGARGRQRARYLVKTLEQLGRFRILRDEGGRIVLGSGLKQRSGSPEKDGAAQVVRKTAKPNLAALGIDDPEGRN